MKVASLLVTVLVVPLFCATIAFAQTGTCSPHEIGPDTSLAAEYLSPVLGQAFGETFEATDTLIESITIWRIAEEDTAFAGYRVYILGTDSLGRPDVNKTLLTGGTVYNYYGDGIHAIPISFHFDPPFALPAPGQYEFAVQLVPCTAVSDIVLSINNPYPGGAFWRHSESAVGGCYLRAAPEEFPGADLIFTVVFCDQSVAARTETWGSVKAGYH